MVEIHGDVFTFGGFSDDADLNSAIYKFTCSSGICSWSTINQELKFARTNAVKEWTGKTIYFNFSSIFGDSFLKFLYKEVSDYLSWPDLLFLTYISHNLVIFQHQRSLSSHSDFWLCLIIQFTRGMNFHKIKTIEEVLSVRYCCIEL